MSIDATYKIPESFLLTAAFSLVFPELKLSSGYMSFINNIDFPEKRINLKFPRHHWLIWENENYIIDVLPLDGIFGVSVPQAVVQNSYVKRYFPAASLFPKGWSAKQKVEFEDKVDTLAEILHGLMEKSKQF